MNENFLAFLERISNNILNELEGGIIFGQPVDVSNRNCLIVAAYFKGRLDGSGDVLPDVFRKEEKWG